MIMQITYSFKTTKVKRAPYISELADIHTSSKLHSFGAHVLISPVFDIVTWGDSKPLFSSNDSSDTDGA